MIIDTFKNTYRNLQVILAGDFYQLPPVPTPEYGDDGSPVTSSPLIQYFHVENLSHIHRQTEVDLITAIHDIAKYIHHTYAEGYKT